MSYTTRLSVNTLLKDARIFDDDSCDSEPPNTPLKSESSNKVKNENIIEDSNSPFNKKLFEGLQIKQDLLSPFKSPEKVEPTTTSRKSAKRSVFTRESPYKTHHEKSTFTNDKIHKPNLRSRLAEVQEKTENKITKRFNKNKNQELETDKEVLERRQKQIDFGKNTIGYDNYVKSVPKVKREKDDPQTPNKLLKYSRRAWDGLIKQWRLKLHKYDDEEN